MSHYLGFVDLGDTLNGCVQVRSGDTPTDADASPSVHVYGSSGTPLTTTTGSLKDSGSITGATNASPIVITSASHGLTTGTRVTVASVGGNTAANGDFTVTRVDANTFSLDGSTGNASYTSGGTWHVSGLYGFSIQATAGNGFASGSTYSVLISCEVSSTAWAELFSFTVT